MLIGILVCPTCQCHCSIDDVVKKVNDGTILHLDVYCTSGHDMVKWQSHPQIGRMPAGNLFICAATLFTGEIYTHINHIAKFFNPISLCTPHFIIFNETT